MYPPDIEAWVNRKETRIEYLSRICSNRVACGYCQKDLGAWEGGGDGYYSLICDHCRDHGYADKCAEMDKLRWAWEKERFK